MIGEEKNAAGNRMNVGKARWGLLLRYMWPALEMVVRVTEGGAKKYSEHGWYDNPLAPEETLDSLHRHYLGELSGEYHDAKGVKHFGPNDPESGLPHWAHMVWNGLAYGSLVLAGKSPLASDRRRPNEPELVEGPPRILVRDLTADMKGFWFRVVIAEQSSTGVHAPAPGDVVKYAQDEGTHDKKGDVYVEHYDGRYSWLGPNSVLELVSP